MMCEDDKSVYRCREAEDTQKIKNQAARVLSRQEVTVLQSHSDKTRMRTPITTLSLGFCYRPKCVPPNFVCWIPNTQYVRRWLYMEARSSKKWLSSKEAIRMGSHWFSRCAYKKRRLGPERHQGWMQTEERPWGHSKDTQCKLRREASAELQPAKCIDLGLLASRKVRKKILLMKPPSLSYFVMAALASQYWALFTFSL